MKFRTGGPKNQLNMSDEASNIIQKQEYAYPLKMVEHYRSSGDKNVIERFDVQNGQYFHIVYHEKGIFSCITLNKTEDTTIMEKECIKFVKDYLECIK